MTTRSKEAPKCGAYGGTITYHGLKRDVFCVLPMNHGNLEHAAAPLGQLQKWKGTFKRAAPPNLRVVDPLKMQKCKNGHPMLVSDWCYECEVDKIKYKYDTDRHKTDSVSIREEPKLSWWRRLWSWLFLR